MKRLNCFVRSHDVPVIRETCGHPCHRDTKPHSKKKRRPPTPVTPDVIAKQFDDFVLWYESKT